MKVIGYKDTDTFIVTASANELAKLLGVQYATELVTPIKVGDDINASDLFKNLKALKEQKAKLEAAIQTIQQVNMNI